MFAINKPKLDQSLVSKALKRFEWLISFLICRFGFVHQILGMMTKHASADIPTMGVRVSSGARFELYYNPAFMETLSDEEATFIMYHEVLHLALHHCTSRRFDNLTLGNIACDLAVNELIPVIKGSCERPVDEKGKEIGMFVDTLRNTEHKGKKIYKDIKNKQSAEWYYDFLMKHAPKENKGSGSGDGSGDGKEKDKGSGKEMDDHGGWSENEVADEKVRAKVSEISKKDMWGTVSAGDKELIMAAQTKKINWSNLLKRFIGNMVWKERETTRKRPNRRTGWVHPGYKKIHVDRHLVAVDTSGSVDSNLLSRFLTTINNMSEFAPIDLVQFDWAKTDGPHPWDKRRNKFEFSGRGGTNFQPVMDIVKERKYKSVVILTDGEASAPTKPHARVVWVLPKGCEPPVEWGQRIYMETHC